MYIYDRKVLKQAAKNDLKPFYWRVLLAYLAATIISQAFNLYSTGVFLAGGRMDAALVTVIDVVSFCLTSVFAYGICAVFTDIVRTKDFKFETIFCGFKRFGSTVLLGVLQLVFIILWSLLFFIPGIIKMIAYSMVYYIQRDNPDMSANECLKASIRLTKGHKMDIFILLLSFIGWYILAGFVYGALSVIMSDVAAMYLYAASMVFITPYVCMSMARMYDFLILNYNEQNKSGQEVEVSASMHDDPFQN